MRLMDLENKAELYESIFLDAQEGILVLDETGNILKVNDALALILGYTAEGIKQKEIQSLFPGLWKKIGEGKKSLQQKDKSIIWGHKKDGSQVPMEAKWVFTGSEDHKRIVLFIQDVTAKELMGQELHLQEIKNKALLEAAPDMMFTLNRKGNFVDFYVPEHHENIIPREEMLGANIKEMFAQDSYPELHESLEKIFKTRENQRIELQMSRNGPKCYEVRLVPMNNQNVMGMVRDMTDTKHAETELRREKEKLQQYLNVAASMFVVINREHKIELVNNKACEVLGYEKEELLGKDWFQTCLPKEEQKMVLALFDDVMEGRRPLEEFYENHVVDKNGKKRLIRWRNAVMKNEKGESLFSLSSGVDITARKTTLDILNLRNRALEATSNSILITDAQKPDMPIIFSNKAFQQMTGYSEDEVLGKNCRFLQEDDRDQKEIEIMRNALAKGEGCQVELRNYKKDGTLFWNKLTITPVHDKNGKLTHFIGIQEDVTRRVQEEQLKDQVRQILEMTTQNKPLKKVAEEIIDGAEMYLGNGNAAIYLVDAENERLKTLAAPRISKSFLAGVEQVPISSNTCSCSAAAYSKKTVITENIAQSEEWTELRELAQKSNIHASWSLPILDSLDQVLGTFTFYLHQPERPSERALEVVNDMARLSGLVLERLAIKKQLEASQKQLQEHADLLEKKVSARTSQLRKTVLKLVETNQKLSEQTQLAETNQKIFSAIAQNFPKGVIFVFNEKMEFVFVEGEELSRINLDKEDFRGKHIDDIALFSKNRMNRIKGDIQKTLEGQHLSFEVDYGTEVYAVNSAPLQALEGSIWALFVYSNITEQKHVEKEIRSNLEKERELSELKSRFVSMASHEFRTPLSAILSSAILIEKQNAPDKVEKRRKYVDQIKSNVRNLVVILNDFLSLGKLEEGKTISQPELFDIMELTQALIEEMTVDKKEVHRYVLEHNGEPRTVYLDPKLIRHVLINLFSNAMKYSPPESTITVSVVFEEDTVEINIKDEGIGIPANEQEHLFERFFRARNAENIQGTGIGLHIVKQYTELMGGEVSFKSKENKGTTFTMRFPNQTRVGM